MSAVTVAGKRRRQGSVPGVIMVGVGTFVLWTPAPGRVIRGVKYLNVGRADVPGRRHQLSAGLSRCQFRSDDLGMWFSSQFMASSRLS